jgi:hypothetical protein
MFTAVKCKVKRKTISNIRKGKFKVFPKHTNAGNFQELLHFAGTPANLSMCREIYANLLGKVIFFVYIVQLPESDIQNFYHNYNFLSLSTQLSFISPLPLPSTNSAFSSYC